MRRTVTSGAICWVTAISLLHGVINLGWFDTASRRSLNGEAPFRVGFIPVTCHLTCPVTHFINDQVSRDGLFEPIRFSGWPELKETFLASDLEATFILAPLAMSLREQGVPIKIVFGAIDYNTRFKMRADLIRIWQEQRKTILFVTHDIEEAVQLADRVLVMTRRPATIRADVAIDPDRPRDLKTLPTCTPATGSSTPWA